MQIANNKIYVLVTFTMRCIQKQKLDVTYSALCSSEHKHEVYTEAETEVKIQCIV